MIRTRRKGTVPGNRPDHIITNEAAKLTKFSNNAYCCNSRILPSTCVHRDQASCHPRRHCCYPSTRIAPHFYELIILLRSSSSFCKEKSCCTYVLYTYNVVLIVASYLVYKHTWKVPGNTAPSHYLHQRLALIFA